MLELYIMRHGESGFERGQKDFDRTLTSKGVSDVQKMSENVLKEVNLDFVLCSAAQRTKETLNHLNVSNSKVLFEEAIYEASLETILHYINRLKGKKVLYIGHNPGVTLLVQYLSGYSLAGMVPGSCVKVVCGMEDWEMTSQDLFQFEWYRYPEMF